MRRKRRAVVIHTVYGATAKDGVVQSLDPAPPPRPSLLTPPSPLQGQCSTKFLSPHHFCVCLALNVFMWLLGNSTHGSIPSPAPSSRVDRGKKRRVDRDPGILTCCYSRTQAPGFPQPSFFFPSSSLQGSRHLGPSLFPLFSLPNCLSWDPVVLAPCALYLSPKHLIWVSNSPSFHCQGPSQIPGNVAPAMLVKPGLELIHLCIYIVLTLSPCLWYVRYYGRAPSPSPPLLPTPLTLNRS